MPKEVVTIHTGQAGVQMGSAIWELYCVEHGVTADGKLLNAQESNLNDRIETLFFESNGQYIPRTVFVDLEPTVIDEVRSGTYKNLFSPSSLISGNEDAANNYSRGYYTIGKGKIDLIMDAVRKMVNNCESVSAFQIMHSYAGGTGSGLTSLFLLKLSETYGKKFRVSAGIFPSSTMSQSTVDPYNSLLHTHTAIEHIDCGILFDNESLYRKAINHLSCARPTYSLMNRLISQMVTCVFLSHRYRYEGTHHIDVDELLTNLVPYPRIHFPVLSYAPIVSPDQIKHEKTDVGELTRSVFQGDAHFLDCSFENNKYLSCCLLYRGYISPRSVYDAVAKVKCDRKISFVDWCPTGFKLGLNTIPPVGIPNLPLATASTCLCMVSGNVGIKDAWKRDRSKFDLIFNKRAFVHWFVGEGLEEGEFLESREDIVTLENDYEEISKDSEDMDGTPTEKAAEDTKNTKNKSMSSEVSSASKHNKPMSIKNSTSKISNVVLTAPNTSIMSAKSNSMVSNQSPKKSSINYQLDEPRDGSLVQQKNESPVQSEILDMSGNAFMSNNYYCHDQSYQYSEDLDYDFEVEDPSWIDGSPTKEQKHSNKIYNANNSQSAYNNYSGTKSDSTQMERRTFRTDIPVRHDSLNHSPKKLTKVLPNTFPNRNYKNRTKHDFVDQSQKIATRTPWTVKRSWLRKGPASSNNSYVNSETNAEYNSPQIDNLFSKMDFELFDKDTGNNSKVVPFNDSNPFTKSNQWGFSNVANLVSGSPENHLKSLINSTTKTNAFSTSISSFVENSSPSNNSTNVQCSPFHSLTPLRQVNNTDTLSFSPQYMSMDLRSNSASSLALPPPPDHDELIKTLTTKRENIPYCEALENCLGKNVKSNSFTKPNNITDINIYSPAFSNFVPAMPLLKIPGRTKIPIKSSAVPINLTKSCIFESTIQNVTKKRNLIISPIESLDCEASKSKQPKLSLINFIFKKFQSSKMSIEEKRLTKSSKNISKKVII